MPKPTVTLRLLKPFQFGGRAKAPGDWIVMTEKRAARLIERGIADLGERWDNTPGDKHVLMVSKHNCSRVAKEAWALRERGWRVDSVSVGFPSIPAAFDVLRVVPEEDIAAEIAASSASLIHVHNEPDVLMRYADEGANGRPVIYDWHDLEYHRYGVVTEDQTFAFGRADGIVATSRKYAVLAHKLHRKPTVPEAVVHTCLPRAWAPAPTDIRQRKGVVYAGGSQPDAPEQHRWRDHTHVARAFEEAGIRFDLYVPGWAAKAYPHGYLMMPYDVMMQTLPRYKWGFMGTERWTEKWSVVIPNKLFEYLACGLPILACNAPAVVDYMKDSDCVVSANSMDKLIERMNDPRKTNWLEMSDTALASARYMDDEIEQLIQLYDALMGTFACPYCDRQVKTKLALYGHVKSKHPESLEAFREIRE
jgi:glycosyltransferase involved in cell wall biosynthesis